MIQGDLLDHKLFSVHRDDLGKAGDFRLADVAGDIIFRAMSVAEIERQLRTLPPEELAQFAECFDAYLDAGPPADNDGEDDELDEAQKQEILRSRASYLADPSIAEAWDGTTERILDGLNQLRRQKAEPR